MYQERVRIGTLVDGRRGAAYMNQILPHGFESFALTFWQTLDGIDLHHLADEVGEALSNRDTVISCLSVYGNPLGNDEADARTRDAWEQLIEAARLFNCTLVTGFAGRVPDCPVPDSLDRFAQVFMPLAELAADHGVRLAFENCAMGGDWARGTWNIAHNPTAWEMMLDALHMDNVGLEWEPAHQLHALIDPIAQLRKWAGRIFHVHGKDASVHWDVIREYGIGGCRPYAFDRTPGFGDSNWCDIITELRRAGFNGSIDIEGWHDPIYRGEMEMMGQVRALRYLKECRGGDYIPDPIFVNP